LTNRSGSRRPKKIRRIRIQIRVRIRYSGVFRFPCGIPGSLESGEEERGSMPSVSWLLLLLLLLLLLELLLEPLLGNCWFTLLSSWFHSCSYTTAPLLPYHHMNYTIKVSSATSVADPYTDTNPDPNPDPDPHVLGPPGSGSGIRIH
jgi:hypothetical protein